MADKMDVEGGAPAPTDLSNSNVLTMTKEAAAIANTVLTAVIAFLEPGKLIADVCEFGDALITKMTSEIYKTKKMEKGIAFPTCISVNETVGHYSPLKSESKSLAAGDSVKIDLGVHLDGHIALVAHTVVLGASAAAPVTGPAADVMTAAYKAAEIALRLIKPGNKNTQVTEAIEKVAAVYGVKPVTGATTYQLQHYILEGDKKIAMKNDPENKIAEVEFAANEAYALDICFTTGEGKPIERESRTTVFKRIVDVSYQLKMKASRWLVSEVNKRFPALPFTIRALGDEAQARMGVVEAVKHGVLGAYPVVFEKEGCSVAQFRFTVLLLTNGTQKVTGLELPAFVKSEKVLTPELAEIEKIVPYVAKAKKGKAAAAPAGGDVEMTA